MFVPLYKNGMGRERRNDSDYGEGQMNGGEIQYDTNFIDYLAYIKNLKTNCIELTERRYVDMPMKKQKEIPIEN